MRKLLYLSVTLLISIIFIGCSNSSATSTSNSKNTNEKINVTMDAQPVINNGKVKFDIKTNLPDKTDLMISLKNNKANYAAQDKVSVTNGTAETSEFSKSDMSLKSGDYQLEITTPFADAQPSSVKSIIGDKGANLTGSLAKDDDLSNKIVDFKKTINIK